MLQYANLPPTCLSAQQLLIHQWIQWNLLWPKTASLSHGQLQMVESLCRTPLCFTLQSTELGRAMGGRRDRRIHSLAPFLSQAPRRLHKWQEVISDPSMTTDSECVLTSGMGWWLRLWNPSTYHLLRPVSCWTVCILAAYCLCLHTLSYCPSPSSTCILECCAQMNEIQEQHIS